ncbi:MAG TPA: hypothetical protein VLW85_15835 [Myxococcales bacterium]|nr:hypothetical protein [Myxococcales bacterium]
MIGRLSAVVLACACAKSVPAGLGIGEPCITNGDCAAGFICTAGRCALPANLGGCQPNALRCNGPDVEQCGSDGLGYALVTTCATGCTAGACRPQLCTPNAARCEGDAAEACTPSGDGWALVQECATHCDPDTGHCRTPACAPFTARCSPGGANSIEVCDAYGSGYVVTQCGASEICNNGICISSSAGCAVGDLRCNGADAQVCVAGAAAGTTQWQTRETCVSACNGGVCDSAGGCASMALHAAVAVAPGDGVSSVLFYSDPIASASGLPLRDGEEFTVSVTTAGATADAAVASADADASLPGVQVKSAGGVVRFVVTAPSTGTGDALVNAQARLASGPSCGASAQLTFSAGASAGVVVAQDFSAGASAVPGGADWNTQEQALLATFPYAAGDGRDGALSVPGSATTDLSAGPAPSYQVVQLGPTSARVNSAGVALSGGDEVILWDAEGSASGSGNAGAYELLTVASASGDTVTFTAPVRGFYGAAADQDVALQHVVLQRVPHFSSLTIAPTGVLTTAAWNGQTGGLLAVRVAGLAKIQGDIDMDGRGFRGAASTGASGENWTGLSGGGGGTSSGGGAYGTAGTVTPGVGGVAGQPYGTPNLTVLHMGSAGGCFNAGSCSTSAGRGGGAILLFAGSIAMQADGDAPQPWQGKVHADGQGGTNLGGGAGGSVWLAAGSVTLGIGTSGRISAGGGGNGGSGRIRLDYMTTDVNGTGSTSTNCSRTAPACTLGITAPLSAQSPVVYQVNDALKVIHAARLELALGAPAAAVYRVSASEPADFSDSMAAAGDSVTFTVSPGGPMLGNVLRWRAELQPPPGTTQRLLGLQFSLDVH